MFILDPFHLYFHRNGESVHFSNSCLFQISGLNGTMFPFNRLTQKPHKEPQTHTHPSSHKWPQLNRDKFHHRCASRLPYHSSNLEENNGTDQTFPLAFLNFRMRAFRVTSKIPGQMQTPTPTTCITSSVVHLTPPSVRVIFPTQWALFISSITPPQNIFTYEWATNIYSKMVCSWRCLSCVVALQVILDDERAEKGRASLQWSPPVPVGIITLTPGGKKRNTESLSTGILYSFPSVVT